MTESNLIQVDNETLRKEYEYFKGISSKSENTAVREDYLKEMQKVYDASDKKHDGKIDRKEFEVLIKGYFDMKSIQSTQENYDQYFDKLDIDHDQKIELSEFITFMDQSRSKFIVSGSHHHLTLLFVIILIFALRVSSSYQLKYLYLYKDLLFQVIEYIHLILNDGLGY